MREGYFLEEIESGDRRAEGGELTVLKPHMVEVNQISVTETEDVDFLQHLASAYLLKRRGTRMR